MTVTHNYDLSSDSPPVEAVIGFFRALLAQYRTDGQTAMRPIPLAGDEVENRLGAGGAQVLRLGSAACAVVQGTLALRDEIRGTRGWQHRLETVGLSCAGRPARVTYTDQDEAYPTGTPYRKETVLSIEGVQAFHEAVARLWKVKSDKALPDRLP